MSDDESTGKPTEPTESNDGTVSQDEETRVLQEAPTRRLDKTRKLEPPAAGDESWRTRTATDAPPIPPGDKVGQRVGKILILDLLGVGGMGRVYSGWDEKLERRVALKSIRRRHALSEELKARFLQEAQILSKIRHPNICQIYDYVEGEDADYLVLELIEGRTLVDLPRSALDHGQRLRLAVQLADVLAAAHAAGVVHRDLKPANVMVTPQGEAKMLDFGIARSIDEASAPRPDGAAPSEASGFETQAGFVVGTPQYMSPEQARGERATPASDMYSFGLLLQELFTGRPPYDPRLSTMELLGAVQEGRTEDVAGLDPELTRLLERLKSPAPGARPSAPDTVEQLRLIADAPRRLRLRRLKVAAVALLAVLALVMTFQAVRIQQESERAKEAAAQATLEAETARQVLDVLLSLFEASDPWQADAWLRRGEEVTVREVLERGAERLENQLQGRPAVRARLMKSLGEIHNKLGLFEASRALLEAAVEARRETGERLGIASGLHDLAELDQIEGRYEEAEKLYLEALEIREAEPETPATDLADSYDRLGRLYSERGPADKAKLYLERGLTLRRQALGDEHLEVATSLHHLGNLNDQQGHLAEAEDQLRQALAMREKLLDENHPFIAKTLNALGIVLDQKGEPAEAEAVYRRALEIMGPRLADDEPQITLTQMNLGSALKTQGEHEAAEEAYLAALAGLEKRLGREHPRVAEALGNLGVLRLDQGRFAEAEDYLERARGIFEKAFGAEHPSVAMCLGISAKTDLSRRRWPEASKKLNRARSIFAATLGEDHPEVARTAHSLAHALIGAGRLDAAATTLEEARDIASSAGGEEHFDSLVLRMTAGELARRRGDLEEAGEHLAAARRGLEALAKDQGWSRLIHEEANLARDEGRPEAALESYEEAARRLEDKHGAEHPAWIDLLEDHAEALRLAGKSAEAAKLEDRAGALERRYDVR